MYFILSKIYFEPLLSRRINLRFHHFHEQRAAQRHFGRRGAGFFGRDWGIEPDDGGRSRRRVFDSSDLRLLLLKLIADQPRHGYELIRAIEELTGGSYVPSPGMVYPTLTMLQEMGHIAEAKAEGTRKAFMVTEEGIVHLDTRKDEVDALLARLATLADQRARTDAVPIRRAMANLRAVLMHRLAREDLDKQTLHDAVAIIDEAAQRIERL